MIGRGDGEHKHNNINGNMWNIEKLDCNHGCISLNIYH